LAIKNTNLGGTDWAADEKLASADLNDTFDAAYNVLQTLSTFWLNSDLYSEYENFNSESTGAISSNTNWTFSGTTSIVESTNAGGETKELYIHAASTGAANSYAETKLLDDNRHTFCRVYAQVRATGSITDANVQAGFAKDSNYYNIITIASSGSGQYISCLSCIHVINTGDGAYDLYIGGKKVASYSGVSASDAQLQIRCDVDGGGGDTAQAIAYIDDIRQSAYDVN